MVTQTKPSIGVLLLPSSMTSKDDFRVESRRDLPKETYQAPAGTS